MASDDLELFCRALVSDGPSLPRPAQIFAPFIGSWDLTVRWFDAGGQLSRTEPGEWHFAWVLEGRAIQDVWIVPPRAQRTGGALYEYGTSVRFYDPQLEAWQSTWIGPMHGVVRTFVAHQREDAVVLETTPGVSPAMRWSFREVAADSFTWTNEVREGEGWRIQQTFEARRQRR
jgi:hypothetical protein